MNHFNQPRPSIFSRETSPANDNNDDDDDDDDDDLVPYALFRAAELDQRRTQTAGAVETPSPLSLSSSSWLQGGRSQRRSPPQEKELVFINNGKDELYDDLGLAKPYRPDRKYADRSHTDYMARPRRTRKRKILKKGFATGKSALEWKLYYAKDQPGPGAYSPNDTRGTATNGRFSEHYNASALERLCREASQLPSPMSYKVRGPRSGVGIKFTTGRSMSPLDLYLKEIEGTPGPGAYGDVETAGYKCEGCQKFNLASRDPPTIADKRPTPSPIDYDPVTLLGNTTGAAFQGRPRSYIEQLYWTRRDNPGPGAYDVASAEAATRPSSGCRLLGRPKFYLEELYYTRKDNPGPGAYGIVEIPPSQVACRFGSGTLEDDEVSLRSILTSDKISSKTVETLRSRAEEYWRSASAISGIVDDTASQISTITNSVTVATPSLQEASLSSRPEGERGNSKF